MKKLKKISIEHHSYLFLLLTCLAFVVRFGIALQDISYLDHLFLPDDTFYILSITRSIGSGLGPTADRVQLTNGLQPLISLLQLPIFLLNFNGDKAVKLAVYLSAFWGGLSTLVLSYLLKHLSSIRAAVIGAVLWISCPIIIQNDLNGMESSLAGFLSLLAILLVLLIDKKLTGLRLSFLGLVCGLTYLARVDTCFLLLAIGVFALLRWGLYPTIYFIMLALLVVLPWWIYSFTYFATVIPESGRAIEQIIAYLHRSRSFNTLASLYVLIEWLPFFRITLITGFLGVVLTFYILIKPILAAKIYFQHRAMLKLILVAIGLQWLFYTYYFPAFWFYSRYFYLIYTVILLFLALILDGEFKRSTKIAFAILTIILFSFCINLWQIIIAKKTPNADIYSLKGYRDVALGVLGHLNPGDRVGAFQSGALSYYAPLSVRVINLDGVVNGAAAQAFKNKTIKNYVDSQHMNRFADWDYNAYLFKVLYGSSFPAGCFNTIFIAKKQGTQRFTLRHYKPICD